MWRKAERMKNLIFHSLYFSSFWQIQAFHGRCIAVWCIRCFSIFSDFLRFHKRIYFSIGKHWVVFLNKNKSFIDWWANEWMNCIYRNLFTFQKIRKTKVNIESEMNLKKSLIEWNTDMEMEKDVFHCYPLTQCHWWIWFLNHSPDKIPNDCFHNLNF